MRVYWIILLAWLCIHQDMLGVDNQQVFGSLSLQKAGPVRGCLTNIAGCLNHSRIQTDQLVPLRVPACITLVDQKRNLIVLQDDSAAMAVYMPLSGLTLRLGQQVIVEGDGFLPYARAFPMYPDQPTERSVLGSFEIPSGRGNHYLTRIRGYLHPPVSGQYTFWIAADDAGEFWISADASPERKQKIAANQIGNAAGRQDWDRYASQRSQPVMLKAGETYYVEALHVQALTRDSLSVGWSGPGIERSVIEGRYLTPWVETVTGVKQISDGVWPTNGVLRECWTDFFVRDFETLRLPSQGESIVPIRSLKLTVTGAGGLPEPQPIGVGMSLSAQSNWQWVELEGDVNFVAGTEGQLQFELKLDDATLGVHVLNAQGLPAERLVDSTVRIRGVLEHAYGSKGELTSSVLWVPDSQQISVLESADSQKQDLNLVSICELEPSNPAMSWGRRVSVRGRIINRTTNGLIVVEGDDNYQGFCAADGTNWMALGKPVGIGMSNSVQAGLAVVSGHDTEQITASFSHLQGWGTNWLGAEIGGPKQAGSFSVRDGILNLKGSGRKMGERGDQLYYLGQPLPGDGKISAQLTEMTRTNSRAQSGLMVRESLAAGSPFAAVLFAPATGPVFQYRRAVGDSINGFESKPAYRQFRWLKLIKQKSLLQVQGEPGPEIGTNQEIKITGMITWRENIPVLTDAFFESSQTDNRLPRPMVGEPPQTIASFVARALHPPESLLIGRMTSPVLRGMVTFCGGVLGQNRMFVQSGDEGAVQLGWSDTNARPKFAVGQLVEVRGNATVRKFPVVLEPYDLKLTGWGTLPVPEQYSPVLVKTGSGQGRWVEAAGVVQSAETNGLLNLMTKDGVLAVWIGQRQVKDAKDYVDTLVRLRGVLSLDPARPAQLLVPSPEFVEVQARAPVDPFALPNFSIAQLAALDVKPERLRRMKSGGVVTCCLPQGVFFQDDTGGAFVQTSEASVLCPGDRVEVVGFPSTESGMVMLSESSVRKIGGGNPPKPMHLSMDELVARKSAGMLVSLEAMLIEQRDTSEAQLLTLQIGTKFFEVARLADVAGRLPQIPVGSRLAITGVCRLSQSVAHFGMAESEAAGAIASLKIWIPAPANVVILERPPWWTLKRAAWVGGLFALGLFGALIRVRILRRRVTQKARELQATMSQLEKETRTAAVLAERDRLAGEIHDSLEQGLTAIMLQLDAANKRAEKSPEARGILRVARNMAEFSRAEVQHAVWDMQSPLLANADLGTALTHVASLISSVSSQVKVNISGCPQSLPSSVEHHLLRIGQEAVTNAVKHAQAKNIRVTLDYTGSELILSVKDDGCGFSSETVQQITQSGHFGLHGIRARANKIGAQLDVSSLIGIGTTITVRMKLNPENEVSPSQI